jgi:hypothetical protein
MTSKLYLGILASLVLAATSVYADVNVDQQRDGYDHTTMQVVDAAADMEAGGGSGEPGLADERLATQDQIIGDFAQSTWEALP